ncbi:hypothetical protein ACSDQ9_13255 [Aestuariimicrobium soli]|uniref:SLAC1 family transporter n=1 Tax=Aestuariimicrobium soli TaxID=2035834 RepID=UPI003EBE966A
MPPADPSTTPAPLPPAGPAWFGSVMGPGILSVLLHTVLNSPLAGADRAVFAAACFVIAWVLGVAIFVVAYRPHWLRQPLPLELSTTAWIPLGIVGQSTAAAIALTIGVPLVAWAVWCTIQGFRRGLPFGRTWWSMTFPVGTLALGSHVMGSHMMGLHAVAVAATLCLLGTWTIAATGTVRAVTGLSRESAPRSASA